MKFFKLIDVVINSSVRIATIVFLEHVGKLYALFDKIYLQKTIKEREHTANIIYHKRFNISTKQFEPMKKSL